MHYCYECQKSFVRLRDLCKHERVHRRNGQCTECQVYFTSRDKEEKHRREHHTRSIATQTEQPGKPSKRQGKPSNRPVIKDYRRHPWLSTHRRWQPAAAPSRPAKRKDVSSVAVSKGTTVTGQESDMDIDLNDTTDLSF